MIQNSSCKVKYDLMEHGEIALKTCRICGRSFNLVSLERHEKICETSKKCTKRTVFKSFIQRSREIDLVPVEKEEEKEKIKAKCKEQNGKRVNNSSGLLNNGQSPLKSIPPGYQQCPACSRYFNQKAADRHISWCQEQKNRLPKTPSNTVALERLQTRVKYQAPRLKKKSWNDGSIRLVKSAESVRESSCLRTHSSPSLLTLDRSQNSSSNQNAPKRQESILKSDSISMFKNNNSENHSSKVCAQEQENKKTVKFKEQFPIYNKDRNKNLDMLRALRLHLSRLSTSEEHFNSYILRSKEHEIQKDGSDMFSLPEVQDGSINKDVHMCSSEGVHHIKTENVEKRMPRFCYNCGTKYPIVNAKFCCECGVQRLIFGISDQRNSPSECL